MTQADNLQEAHQRIKELERTQEEMRAAFEAAESANKAKSEFLANMSHEIRTPMNSILGFSELALDYEIHAKAREYIHNIRESANWLLNIINDILDISKIESGSMELEKIPFELSDLFNHCQVGLMHLVNEKGISLYCNAEKIPGRYLMGDPVKLRQVLTNLLSNAVKFTQDGSVNLLATVANTINNRASIYFEIKDTGIGMSPDQMTRIFEPFLQADASVARKFGGTGLGLVITKNIIEVMGGRLKAKSKLDIGTTFYFSLDFDLIDETDAVAVLAQQSVIEKPNFTGEVLVFEDNEMNQIVISENLAKVGLITKIASNGKEAIQLIKKRMGSNEPMYDLIFMDIYLPGMDGMETSAFIKTMGIQTPIVALTASAIASMPKEYAQSGMCDYLSKPFTTQDLWVCLAKYFKAESYSAIAKDEHSQEEEKMLGHLKLNFVTDNQSIYERIENALSKGDVKTAHRLAHTIKSNAGQINETQLQDAAGVVEARLESGHNSLESGQLKRFKLELEHVLEKMAPLLQEANNREVTQTEDKQTIQDIITKLEPLVANKNPDCEEMLEEIRTIPGSEELIKAIENFKFKQAMEELQSIKKRWELT